MDDERQSGLARGGDMRAEALLLHVARAVVVMIVEPRLADRHHLGMTRDLDQFLDHDIGLLGGIVRMRADRAEYIVMRLDDVFQFVEAMHARGDGHDQSDACRPRALEHGVEIGAEFGKIEMAMAVDQHRR